jgi:hypothetical protein
MCHEKLETIARCTCGLVWNAITDKDLWTDNNANIMAKNSTRLVSVAGKRRLIAHGLGEVGFLGNIKMQKFQGAASVSKAIGRLMC